MHYGIGDVHGCYDELILLLQKIERQDPDAKFIFVGDFIDRGPKVREVLQWAMKNITLDGKYQSVRGNHEQLMLEGNTDYLLWCEEKCNMAPIMDFFRTLPFSKAITVQTKYGKNLTYRFVHGWYDYEEPRDSQKQKECNLWERNTCGMPGIDEVIVHGHTPTIFSEVLSIVCEGDVPGMIGYRPNAINIDGGCCYFNHGYGAPAMLCGICLETLEEFYPYTIEERFIQSQREVYKRLGKENVSEDTVKKVAKAKAQQFEKKYLSRISKEREQILKKMGL